MPKPSSRRRTPSAVSRASCAARGGEGRAGGCGRGPWGGGGWVAVSGRGAERGEPLLCPPPAAPGPGEVLRLRQVVAPPRSGERDDHAVDERQVVAGQDHRPG